MKTGKHLMVVTLVLMVIFFIRWNASAYNMIDLYPITQGNEWTYVSAEIPIPVKLVSSGTEVVNGVETTKLDYRLLFLPLASLYLAWDSDGLKQYKIESLSGITSKFESLSDVEIYDQPFLCVPAQFDLGEVCQDSYSFSKYSSDGTLLGKGTGSHTILLKSMEDVTVPAGTFKDCLKIIDSGSWQISSDWYGGNACAFWYAPNVGMIKSSTNTFSQDPEKGYNETSMIGKLIFATVDGVHYGCLATSALEGDTNALDTLRKFRDEVLSKTPEGQEIIRLYYEWSPVIAGAMEEDGEFKKEVEEMIDGVLPLIRELVK